MVCRSRGATVEPPGAGSVAGVAKENKIVLDFVYLWVGAELVAPKTPPIRCAISRGLTVIKVGAPLTNLEEMDWRRNHVHSYLT